VVHNGLDTITDEVGVLAARSAVDAFLNLLISVNGSK
jgi:hypothetical protein